MTGVSIFDFDFEVKQFRVLTNNNVESKFLKKTKKRESFGL